MNKKIDKTQIVIVPWLYKDEWEDIYKKLYSNNCSDLKLALERISSWSSRSHPVLPLGIEATASIVQAKLEDLTKTNESCNEKAKIFYSMALIRFVNLVSELGQAHRFASPVRDAAQKVGIPEWIVDLRHKATHGQMPSLNMQRASASIMMEWLRLNYWEKERAAMTDWRTDSGGAVTSVDEDIKELITTFQQLRYEILYGKYMKGENESKRAMESDILQSIEIVLKKHRTSFIKRLVEPGFLIPMENHLEVLLKPEEIEFQRDDTTFLPRSLEIFWKPILRLFDSSKNLQILLESLLGVEDPLAHRLAVTWVERILAIIVHDGTSSEVYTYPLASCLNQDYTLDWLVLLKTGLKSPNKYAPKVLNCIAQQVHHVCDSQVGHSLMALAAIYLGLTVEKQHRIGGNSQRIYTVKDISAVRNGITKASRNNRKTTWKLCVDHIEWNRYPIGTVPESDFGLLELMDLQAENPSPECTPGNNYIYRQNGIEGDEEISENEVYEVEDHDHVDYEETFTQVPKMFGSITVF